jgi:hypothetical protein
VSAGGDEFALDNIGVEHRSCNRRASLAEAGRNLAAEAEAVAEIMGEERPGHRGDLSWWRCRLENGQVPREGIVDPHSGHRYPGRSRDWLWRAERRARPRGEGSRSAC